MPVRAEVQRRAEHLGRSMKAGLSPLWAVIAVIVILVGGDVAITVAWGVRHLIWGLVILLGVLLGVLGEGSYRLARRRETDHAGQLADLRRQHDAVQSELEVARMAPAVPSASPPAAVNSAEWIAECQESGEFPDKVLLFVLRHRFDNPSARLAFGDLRCTVIDPDGITTSTTGRPSHYVYGEYYFHGARSVRPGLYRSKWEGRRSNGEWVDIIEDEHEVRVPAEARDGA